MLEGRDLGLVIFGFCSEPVGRIARLEVHQHEEQTGS
jgi:hypothetical protein